MQRTHESNFIVELTTSDMLLIFYSKDTMPLNR